MKKFLEASEFIDYLDQGIQDKTSELFLDGMNEVQRTKTAYEFVRDAIPHSFDSNAKIITVRASDVLRYRTGICHAKANLLAALLRSQGIPTGFCFQHITLLEDDSLGCCVHACNAVYCNHKWVKLDVRGNKPGVNAQFSLSNPTLAFPIREGYDEFFWKGIYATPHLPTMKMLENAKCLQDVLERMPDMVEEAPDICE